MKAAGTYSETAFAPQSKTFPASKPFTRASCLSSQPRASRPRITLGKHFSATPFSFCLTCGERPALVRVRAQPCLPQALGRRSRGRRREGHPKAALRGQKTQHTVTGAHANQGVNMYQFGAARAAVGRRPGPRTLTARGVVMPWPRAGQRRAMVEDSDPHRRPAPHPQTLRPRPGEAGSGVRRWL